MLRYGLVSALIVAVVSVFLFVGPVSADEVVLKNGLVVSGKVTVDRKTVKVERPGGTVTYARTDVKEINKAKTVWEVYEEKKKTLVRHPPLAEKS